MGSSQQPLPLRAPAPGTRSRSNSGESPCHPLSELVHGLLFTDSQLLSGELKRLQPRAPAPAGGAEPRPGPLVPSTRAAYLVPSEPRASMPELARHGLRLRRVTPSRARGGSGPRGGEAGWAVDPPRRLIWARGGEARGEGAAAGVSAFRGRRSGKAARAAQPWREARGAAGPGRGRGCRPALRPHSWRRPSRGPGACSAPPPSRRLLARVTPAEPGCAGLDAGLAGPSCWRDGAAMRGWPRGAAKGAGAGPGSRDTDPRPDAFLSPRRRVLPDRGSVPFVPTGAGPLRVRGAWIHGAGRAPRTVVGRPPPRPAECPHWPWPSGNGNRCRGRGGGWVEPFASRWLQQGSSAEEGAPLTPLTQPGSRTRPGPARLCGPRGLSGRDSARQRLCSMSPREELLTATSPGRGLHPAPSLWPPPPGLGRRILICAQVRAGVHSNTWVSHPELR